MKMIEVPFEGRKVFQVVAGYPPETSRLRKVVEEVAADLGLGGQGRAMQEHERPRPRHRRPPQLPQLRRPRARRLAQRRERADHQRRLLRTIDCGLAVNLDRVLAQIEGGIIYGLSIALLGEITVKNGAVVQNNFDDYPVLRIHHTPKKIHRHIVKTDYDPPTGVGEPPTPAVAPALANAIVAAGGPRIREIPFCWRKGDPPGTKVVVL